MVDDSLYVHYSIAPILIEQGFHIVDIAFNGIEGFNLYLIYSPDLVVMDITMPVKSGIETAKDIYNKFPDAKIVFITALGGYKPLLENIENLFHKKAYRILTKPIRQQTLVDALTALFP